MTGIWIGWCGTWKNAGIVREIDPREIQGLKKEAGKTMLVLGSGSIVSELTSGVVLLQYTRPK
jgi:hypothetical protein